MVGVLVGVLMMYLSRRKTCRTGPPSAHTLTPPPPLPLYEDVDAAGIAKPAELTLSDNLAYGHMR